MPNISPPITNAVEPALTRTLLYDLQIMNNPLWLAVAEENFSLRGLDADASNAPHLGAAAGESTVPEDRLTPLLVPRKIPMSTHTATKSAKITGSTSTGCPSHWQDQRHRSAWPDAPAGDPTGADIGGR
jgi:hypothetical protein